MSTSDDVPFSIPTKVQVSVISGTLNSAVVFAVLTGVYSIVYVATMHFYISRRRATKSRTVVLSTISLLYTLFMVQFAVQWYYLNLAIVENGDTRGSIFISALTRGSVTVYALTQTAFCLMFIVSDALLIWRCYQVWGQSLRVTVLPVVFIMAETGTSIALTVLPIVKPRTTISSISHFKSLTCIQAFASFATTALCTLLIGYKINKVSNIDGSNRFSSARFSHIVKVLIESAAIYSLVILVYAIQAAIPISSERLIESRLLIEGYYLQILITAVAGFAPTLIAARIALTSSKSSIGVEPVEKISRLKFQHRSCNDSAMGPMSSHSSTSA